MSMYDTYNLENSTQTPAYVGSDISTKVSVLGQLQQQYNQNRESDDMIGRMVNDNTNLLEQDKPLYNQVANKYRQSLAQRAQSGNYEDMQLGVAKDANDFASESKPFAINKGLVMNRLAEIQKMSDKGPGGTDGKGGGGIGAETADALRTELGQYSGLQKDQNGQYTNYYSGHAIAPDINVDARVKEWAGDIVSQKLGRETKVQEGPDGQLHYITQGGTSETVTPQQIHDAITYGSQSDQGFKDYLHQQQRLKTLGTDKITYDQVANQSPDAKNTADQIQAEADRQGTSFGNIYRQMRMQGVQNDIASNAYQYGQKYIKNDSTSKWEDNGETEATKRVNDLKDQSNFAIPVTLSAYGSAFDTPEKLDGEAVASQQRAQAATAGLKDWVTNNGIKQIGTGSSAKYIDPNGTDVTDQAQRQILQVQQEQSHQATLNSIKQAAMKQSGFNPNIGDKKAAESSGALAMSQAQQAGLTGSLVQAAYMDAYNKTYAQSNPNYQKYLDIVKQKAQAQTITTSAMRFAKKEDNEKLEDLANNLSTSDFDNNLLGLKHVGTVNGGQALTPDEYDKIKGRIHFAGQVIGADGQQHSIFKAEDPKTKADMSFSMDGVTANQPMPKLLGVDAQQLYTQQMIRSATNNENKTARIPLSGGAYLNLRVLGPDEAGQQGNGKYKISVTDKDGKGGVEQNVDDENQLLQKVMGIQKVAGHGN